MLILTQLAGCVPGETSNSSGLLPVEANNGSHLALYDFIVAADADFLELVSRNLGHSEPRTGSDGIRRISMVTTGAYAVSLQPLGFIAEGRYPNVNELSTDDGERAAQMNGVGSVTQALGCGSAMPLSCPSNSDTFVTQYILPFDDIESRLYDYEDDHPAITVDSLGETDVEMRKVLGIQFGPRNEVSNPPTIYIVAAYHAREWITTATSMYLVDWLRDTLLNPSHDPALYASLSDAAVVVVPVVNPDGFLRTRQGQRLRRNNSNPMCPGGVNLNRNHSVTWDEPAFSSFSSCVGEGWVGPLPASEPETKAMEKLFVGDGFLSTSGGQDPAAVLSYHSYGNLNIFPDGWNTSGSGPRCDFDNITSNSLNNCFNPDFQLLRQVFGTTHQPFGADPYFVDEGSGAYRDHGATLLYTVSGDTGLHNTYHPTDPVLTLTPEMPSGCDGHRIQGRVLP